MHNLKQLQLWLDTLSILGLTALGCIVIYFSLPEIVGVASYFSPKRWVWISSMLTNNTNTPGAHIPDHADGNFIMIMYTARILQILIIGLTMAQIFTHQNHEVLIGELGVMMLACLGIKYVPTLMRRSAVGAAISERFEEKISTTIKTKEHGNKETEETKGTGS
jgi:hypothetical protein